MESSTAPKRGVDAATIAEAFRLTSSPTRRTRSPSGPRATRSPGPGPSCASASTPRRRPARAGAAQGRHHRADARQPARVPPRRPRGDDGRGDAVLDLHDLRAQPDRVRGLGRRRADHRHRAAVPGQRAGGAQVAARRRARHRRRRRGACGHARAGRRSGRRRLRRRGLDRGAEPRGRADADLHVGHDRAAQGRRARPPQPARGRQRHRGDRPVPRGRARHLLAAERPHRRARRAPLPADRLRLRGHVLSRTRARSSRSCPRSGRTGSSRSRGSGRS